MKAKAVGYFALVIGLILIVHMLAAAVVKVNETEEFSWPIYVQVGLRAVAAVAGGLLAWRGWRRVRLARAEELAREAARQMLEERRRQMRGEGDAARSRAE